MKKNPSMLLIALFSLFVISLISCNSKAKDKNQSSKPAPVTIGFASIRDVPVILTAVGNVDASATVSIKAQVGGEISKVHFKEGQYVKEGTLLFSIDRTPYENSLRLMEANLKKSSTQLAQARKDVEKYATLLKEGFVTTSQYDQMVTNMRSLEAAVDADRAAVDNARLQLDYCHIYAPISGIIGSILLDKGNIIKANDERPLASINRLTPVYATFSLPERYLAEIREYIKTGIVRVGAKTSEGAREEKGFLTFIDNTVDKTTGTIRLRAEFENPERVLWPGQFVNISIMLPSLKSALVVPSEAVQAGQKGEYVYRIKGDDTVEAVNIVTGISSAGFTVIKQGDLRVDDRVVIEGHMRISPGKRVQAQKKG